MAVERGEAAARARPSPQMPKLPAHKTWSTSVVKAGECYARQKRQPRSPPSISARTLDTKTDAESDAIPLLGILAEHMWRHCSKLPWKHMFLDILL